MTFEYAHSNQSYNMLVVYAKGLRDIKELLIQYILKGKTNKKKY